MMRYPTRESQRTVHQTFGHVLRQALREGATVELTDDADHGFAVVIDGQFICEVPDESFGYPLERYNAPDPDARELVVEYAKRDRERSRRARYARRARKLRTDTHAAAEGQPDPAGSEV